MQLQYFYLVKPFIANMVIAYSMYLLLRVEYTLH